MEIRRAILVLLLLFSVLPPSADSQTQPKRLKSTNFVIREVTVVGDKFLSAHEIQNLTSFARPSWWQFPASFFALFSKARLNAKLVPTDIFSIENRYLSKGFWFAKSDITWTEVEKNKVDVTILVEEGPRVFLSELSLTGGLPEINSKAGGAIGKLKINQPLEQIKMDQLVLELKRVYANAGYPYTDVDATTSLSADQTRASVKINLNQNELVYFGKTEVSGLEKTKQNVVEREIAYKEEDRYSREKLLDTKQRVYSTGLFSFVSLDAKNPETKPQKPDFSIKLVERKPAYMKFGVNAGQSQEQDLTSSLAGEFGHRNLFGSARKLSFTAATEFVLLSKFQYLSSRFTVNYYQPWILAFRIPADLEAYYEPGVKSVKQPYRIERFGGNSNFRFQMREKTRLWLFGSYEQVNVYGINPADKALFLREQGINIRRKVGFSLENDARNHILVPEKGSFTQLLAEFYGGILGGDHNFWKSTFTWSRYFPSAFGSRLENWAVRLKLGWSQPYSNADFVPSFDRFYLGGASSIRGYRENSIGPQVSDSTGTKALGGEILGLANIEYRRSLFWRLGWSMFLDYGNIWTRKEEIRSDNLLLSGGFGLQLFSPLGPLRVDYGRKLLRGSKGLNGGRFHLSILYAF